MTLLYPRPKLWLRHSFHLALILCASCLTPAEAAIIESINQNALPPRTPSGGVIFYSPASVISNAGWYYTPNQTFMLDGIFTRFDFASDASSTIKQVTAIVMTERPAVGGVLLASTTFPANLRGNQTVGGTFEPILFESSKTYFIGLENINDFAVNTGRWTLDANNQPTLTGGADRMLGNIYFSTDLSFASSTNGYGTASDGTRAAYGAPILSFSGTIIPEPGTLMLLGIAASIAVGRAVRRYFSKSL